MQRPNPDEYKPYFQRYIDLVPDGGIGNILGKHAADTIAFFKAIPAGKHDYRYAPGKWSIKAVLMHLIDTERVMCYRALVGAREDDHTILYNMDENLYADNADVSGRTMEDLLEEFAAVRTASQKLFDNITDDQSTHTSQTEDGAVFTPRALIYIIAGHGMHHVNIINERYL